MYNLFYYNIQKMSDEIFQKELSALPKLRQKEILRKVKPEDQKRSLAGDMLAKKYLSKLSGVAPEALIFAKGEHGKPYVLNIPYHFSISHSGDYTVLAISDRPIGVDVEVIRDFSAILARRCFNEGELQYIAGNSPSRKKSVMQRCFYEIWTAKEAYLKYTGQGLSGGLDALSFGLEKDKPVPLRSDIKLTYDYSVPGTVTAVVTDRQSKH